MAENEVGKVSLGVELATDPLSSQAADLERKIAGIAEKAGEKAGRKFAEEAAKAFEKNTNKIGEAGEEAGEEASKGAEKGLKRGAKDIAAETGDAGDKAGKSFFDRFKKNATGGSGGLKALAGKIGKTLFAAFAAKKIFDFGKQAIDLGSDLAEVQNVVDSTFGQGSPAQKSINDFAKNAASQFGLSETMAKRYAGTFGAMGKAFGFTDNEAAKMSSTLTGLAGDVASFYNITQDEAYTKLKSVFTGETESLKDLGVVMTQTALDQYAMSHGFGTTTAKMSEQQKVALRYQFVLDKLSTASGDFARTSGSWANQVRLLKLQFESLAATIGQVLIAALTPAIRALNAFMGVLIKAANTFKSFVFSLFGLESQDMGTGSAGALPEALGDIGDSAGGAADSLGDVGDAAKGAGKDASKAANEIKRSLASFDKITKLTDQSDSGGGSGGSGGGGSGSGGSGGGGAGSLGDTSSALTNTAWSVAESNGPLDKIMEKLQALKNLFMNGFWEGLGDLSVFDSIRSNIEGIGQHLKNIFTDPAVVQAASDCADKIALNLGRVAGSAVSIGATIADNLTGGLNKYLEQHEEDIKQYLIRMFDITGDTAEIVGNFSVAFADVFSIFRSDKAKQITADLINIFATGFGTVLETSAKFARDVLDNITKPFVENKEKFKSTFEGTIGQLSTVVSSVSDTVEAASKVIGNYYDGHVKPLLDSLGDGISEIVDTFLTGWNQHVKPVLDELANKFADVCEAHIVPMMESLGETLGSVVDLLKALWETILQPLINWAVENIMPVLGDMAEAMGGVLLDAITLVADGIKSFSDSIKPAIDFVTDLIDMISNLNFGKVLGDLDLFGKKTKELPGKKDVTISVAVEKAKSWAADAWTAVQSGAQTINNTVKTALEKASTWSQDAWTALKSDGQKVTSTLQTAVVKAHTWVSDAWDAANKRKELVTRTLSQAVQKGGTWIADAWTAAKQGGGTVTRWIEQNVKKGSTWIETAWTAAKQGGGTVTRWIEQNVKKGGTWVDTAWTAAKQGGGTVTRWIAQNVKKGGTWIDTAWTAAKQGGGTVTRWIAQNVKKGGTWSTDAWNAARIKGGNIVKTLTINVKQNLKGISQKIRSYLGFSKGGVIEGGRVSILPQFASGGTLRKGVAKYWDSVQKYADGTTRAGSLFVAGEAGPEIVGHVGGRTEVLNKSQLAATMNAAITNGMTVVSNRLASVIAGTMSACTGTVVSDMGIYLPRLADIGNGIRSDTSQLVAYAKQAEAASGAGRTEEMIELLKKILEILLAWDPDIYIDGQKITSRIISILNAQTRATGRSAIIV